MIGALRRWPFWLGVLIGGVCVFLVGRRVEWAAFTAALLDVHPGWLVAGAGASMTATATAALRWQCIARAQVRLTYRSAFESLTIGNFLNLVLPSRLGDLLRAGLVAQDGDGRISRVLASVVVERYADVMMLLMFALGLASVIRFPTVVQTAVVALAAVAIATLIVLYVAADAFAAFIGRAVAIVAPGYAQQLGRLVSGFSTGLAAAGAGGVLARTLMLSAMAWGLWGVAAICFVSAFELPVPWYAGLFVMVVANLGGLIPAAPAGIGVYHYLAVLALSAWVSTTSLALGFAVVSHAITVGVITLFGLLSLARRGMNVWSAARAGQTWATEINT